MHRWLGAHRLGMGAYLHPLMSGAGCPRKVVRDTEKSVEVPALTASYRLLYKDAHEIRETCRERPEQP
jgi:hypothetical protein